MSATLLLQQSSGGSSGSFLVRADDGNRYWCKTLNNLQSPCVPANEQIVGRLGILIGAPVCIVQPVYIPSALVGQEFRAGAPQRLEEGWASGSAAAEPAVETRDMSARAMDDNARRHAGLYALYDWLGGSDAQWLAVGADQEYISHDHGHYFPGGPNWTPDTLRAASDATNALPFPSAGLDPAELDRLAAAVEGVVESEIVTILDGIPGAWPPGDDYLEALIDYVLARRAPVAERMRALVRV